MTREMVLLWVAEVGMLGALACFVWGWTLRVRDNARHRLLGRIGAWVVLGVLVVLEVVLRLAGWTFPVRSPAALYTHVSVASLAFLLLLAMWYTGARRLGRLHRALHGWFLLTFTTAIALSFLAFRLW